MIGQAGSAMTSFVFAALLLLSTAPPIPASDEPSALYNEGNQRMAVGDRAGAARLYARAHILLREKNPLDGNTQYSLFEAVELYLSAYRQDRRVEVLCEAQTLIDDYETLVASAGSGAAPDVSEPKLRITTALAEAGASCTPETPEPPDPPPAEMQVVGNALATRPEGPAFARPRPTPPAPPDRKRRRMAIAAYSGFGLGGLGGVLLGVSAGLGVRLQDTGEEYAALGANAGELQDLVIGRGRTANALAFAGAAVAAAGLVTGIALLTAARLRGRARERLSLGRNGLVARF